MDTVQITKVESDTRRKMYSDPLGRDQGRSIPNWPRIQISGLMTGRIRTGIGGKRVTVYIGYDRRKKKC